MNQTSTTDHPPRLCVVGCGDVAASLGQLARVLHWDCSIVERIADGDDLAGTDALVVISHDVEIAGPALQNGLAAQLSYVGGMGSRHTQQARRDWLAGRQVDQNRVELIFGPAGLDIGADTPAEIALSIMAEISAVRAGTSGRSISRREGPIHLNGTSPADCPGG